VNKRRCLIYENDISAEKEIQSESSWIQSENEYKGWKKSFSCQKIKRKKRIISIKLSKPKAAVTVVFSSLKRKFYEIFGKFEKKQRLSAGL